MCFTAAASRSQRWIVNVGVFAETVLVAVDELGVDGQDGLW